jgi:hypothetical protein
MRRNWRIRVLRFAAFGLTAVVLGGVVTEALWNWLMPGIFGLQAIGFWQALGLLVLSRMLFGSFRGGHRRGYGHRFGRMRDWEKLTPEEREKFREGMRHRCGEGAAAQV